VCVGGNLKRGERYRDRKRERTICYSTVSVVKELRTERHSLLNYLKKSASVQNERLSSAELNRNDKRRKIPPISLATTTPQPTRTKVSRSTTTIQQTENEIPSFFSYYYYYYLAVIHRNFYVKIFFFLIFHFLSVF
jgi:hypothetical protein